VRHETVHLRFYFILQIASFNRAILIRPYFLTYSPSIIYFSNGGSQTLKKPFLGLFYIVFIFLAESSSFLDEK